MFVGYGHQQSNNMDENRSNQLGGKETELEICKRRNAIFTLGNYM